jgi:hypothetical protein
MKVAQACKTHYTPITKIFFNNEFWLMRGIFFSNQLDELHVCYKNLSIIFKYDWAGIAD